MIVVDTGPLLAVASDKDRYHDACVRLLSTNPGPLLVPSLVLGETCYLLQSRRGNRAEAKFLEAFDKDGFTLIENTPEDRARMVQLLRKYDNLSLGAVDASVIAVAERLNVTDIATVDRLHFSIVKPVHVENFTLLPEKLPNSHRKR
ncbi:MAG: type II toxin-antitoxin system VapC family toxin [Mycobacteriales bacterium]